MDRWVGISIGLIIAIILVVLYMRRTTSGFTQLGATPTEVVPTQIPGTVQPMEPSPVISIPVVNQMIPDSRDYPASLVMTPFNLAEYDGETSNLQPTFEIPTLSGPPTEDDENIEIAHKEKYSEWTP